VTEYAEIVYLSAFADSLANAWQRFGPGPAFPKIQEGDEEDGVWAAISELARTYPAWETILAETERRLSAMHNKGIVSIPFSSARYPPQLRIIEHPPPVLHIHGRPERLSTGVAVVGSRRATAQGLTAAEQLAAALAADRVPILTGMALGIDSAAVRGALTRKGVVLGIVPGSPLDVVPSSSADLYAKVPERGCIVGETTNFPQSTRSVAKANYLRRNRIISGLARLVFAFNPQLRGGTFNQMKWAARQDRPVVVLEESPGSQSDLPFRAVGIDVHAVGSSLLMQTAGRLWTSPGVNKRDAQQRLTA
jgi:DNA protecting protein DprA